MANGFKTTFVGAPTSFSQLGAQAGAKAGAAIQQAFAASAQEKERKQKENEAKYGFDKASMEIIPAGIEPRFLEGLQGYLNEYQSKAAIAKQNPTAENIAAYQTSRQDYLDFEQTSVTQSNFNRQTAVNIQMGKIPGLLGTRQENMAQYNRYRNGEGITSMFKDGQLVVVEGGVEKNWRESTAFSATSVYVPAIEAEESKFSVTRAQADLQSKVYTPKNDLFQVKRQGFAIGAIDKAAARQAGVDTLNAIGETDAAQGTAIVIHAYNQFNKAGAGVTDEDITKATILYDATQFQRTIDVDGTQMGVATITALDEDGKAVFSLSDDDIREYVKDEKEQQKVFRAREAQKLYYESVINPEVDQIKIQDQSANRRAYNLKVSEIKADQQKEMLDQLKKIQTDLEEEYKDTPALSRVTDNTFQLPVNVETVDALSKSGDPINVLGVTFSTALSSGGDPVASEYRIQRETFVYKNGQKQFDIQGKARTTTEIEVVTRDNDAFGFIDAAVRNDISKEYEQSLLKLRMLNDGRLSEADMDRVGIPLEALTAQPGVPQQEQPVAEPEQTGEFVKGQGPLRIEEMAKTEPAQSLEIAPSLSDSLEIAPKFDEQMTDYLLREDVNDRQREQLVKQVESGNFNITFDSTGKPVFTRK